MLAMLFSLAFVIYTRFSSDLQSAKSCKDQEREVREALSRMDIDSSKATVVYDEAESGTKVYRDEFERLNAMMRSGQIGILAVDDQSRLSRSDNAFGFITDLVYMGGRFISTGEGIDTDQTGWELRVKVMELHNSTSIRELGRRVRRGQLGRVLGQCSAGDFCYGYESFRVDPNAAERRGPKPERGLRIKEEHAKWVRQIFAWFNEGHSIAWIAEDLTRQQAPSGHRRRSNRWCPSHVRKMLDNEKYIGSWRWGTTRTIRNSQGRKKQIPVPLDQHVIVARPELRIIDDSTWAATQQRLAELKDLYGHKPGQKQRGPKVHYTELYPSGLLPGIVICSKCGSRMWQQASGPRLYLGCPNRGSDDGQCQLTTRVPVERAEVAVLGFLAKLLTAWPEWLDETLAAMRQQIEEVAHRIPDELAGNESRLRDVDSQVSNLVNALADGRLQSQAVRNRLDDVEREAVQLRKKIDDARKLLSAPVNLPDNEWIQEQLSKLAGVIREGGFESSLLLRKIVGNIEADQVIPPGKTRGYARLRFRIRGWEALKAALAATDFRGSLDALMPSSAGDDSTEEFVIDLGGPTTMDKWAPKIAEMRAAGIKWKEIVRITGLDLNRAYRAWKRLVDAQAKEDEANDMTDMNEESDTDNAA